MEFSTILTAFGLTVFAGLSTGIGSAIAFFAKRTNVKALSVALGFSAGVMIYVSFVEMFTEANHSLVSSLGERAGNWATAGSFLPVFSSLPSWTVGCPLSKIPMKSIKWKNKTMRRRWRVIESFTGWDY